MRYHEISTICFCEHLSTTGAACLPGIHIILARSSTTKTEILTGHCLERPKSATRMGESTDLLRKRMFSNFKSRWQTLLVCRHWPMLATDVKYQKDPKGPLAVAVVSSWLIPATTWSLVLRTLEEAWRWVHHKYRQCYA